MFNNGDKVICINPLPTPLLMIGKSYTVVWTNAEWILLENVFGIFDPEKFISLKEYRKQKINKICLK